MVQKIGRVMSAWVAALGVVICILFFQNCSSSSSVEGSSDISSLDDSSAAILSYPNSGTAVTLVPGQIVTLKLQKPSTMGTATDYIWYVPSDDYSLVAYYGLLVENNGYVYVSLKVKSSYASSRSLRVYFLKASDYSYFDTTGFGVLINPSGTQYSSDAVTEVCSFWSSYAPTFSFNRSATLVADALTVFDNGNGVASLSCSFANSSGGYSTVDCLETSGWPSNWRTASVIVSGASRCGTSSSTTF
ncbi:MAG: hypothetical protein AAGB31_06335 [Bdellovibrio sp.]